jgi:ADP-dependent NAD(P)H-hydrate dehydratase / NAD(P)H-hydrate epimerase
VQADRPAAVQALAERYDGVAVLKGAGTLVQAAGDGLYVCDAGNPGMAVGGMGDLLCGVIAGLRAQGLEAAAAARIGVLLHARAGDSAAAQGGERGLLPSDLLPSIRALANP